MNSISQTLETTQLCTNNRMDILKYIHTMQRKIENKTSYHLTHDRIHLAEMISREKNSKNQKTKNQNSKRGAATKSTFSVILSNV